MRADRRLRPITLVVVACWVALVLGAAPALASTTCFGKFPDLISDICWSCILPISVGPTPVAVGTQEDIENDVPLVCQCEAPPPRYVVYGVSVGFWEPSAIVEATRTPYCMVALDGTSFGEDIKTPRGTQYSRGAGQKGTAPSFYQVHFYRNPILQFLLNADVDASCYNGGRGSFDLAYMTEYDPLWNDDDLTFWIDVDVLLFANYIAVAACSADCIAATIGFPIREMHWCAGCQGIMYPMNGHAQAHVGGVQVGLLYVQRILSKLHRQALEWRYHGEQSLCGPVADGIIDRRAYKEQLIYPFPRTEMWNGRCCDPLGRTSVFWEVGKETPAPQHQDFAFQIFRKRNCCITQ